MDEYVLVNSVDNIDRLHSLVRQDLRDLGVKLPKSKKLRKLNQSRSIARDDLRKDKVFGEPLSHIPCMFIPEYGYVPQFLIDATKVIDAQLDSEGIFRKSGSVNRQKELRVTIEDGQPFDDANIYDVAVLIKQFFRELPEPIFVTHYYDAFIRCFQLSSDKDPKKALLHLCLLLPMENIGALRFILHMLFRIAAKADKNKMTANNLALVMAPNLMHNNKGAQKMSSAEEKLIHIQTCIVELLIRNSEMVGMVGTELRQQLNMMSECFGTDDDLDASDDNTLEDSKDVLQRKKRKRSGSLSGLVSTIAQGFAKLRRSTDGRSINMSSTSTYPGELSIVSNTSVAPGQMENTSTTSATTPCVKRKRRASGDAVPFSTSKKKAILKNLPQKSALASTPFTPASTVKRNPRHDESSYLDTSEAPRLNATTPALGTKTSRKKINLFSSPVSNKSVKRQSSDAVLSSPVAHSKKGKGIFRRLSGNRTEKMSQESTGLKISSDTSPKSSHSDSALLDARDDIIVHSVSSPTLHEHRHHSQQNRQSSSDATVEVMDDECNSSVSMRDVRGRSVESVDEHGNRLAGRSKSLDSPGLRRGQPNTINDGIMGGKIGNGGHIMKRKVLEKVDIGEPCPVIVPVVPNPIEIHADGDMRRSRRDMYEREQHIKTLHKENGEKKEYGVNAFDDSHKLSSREGYSVLPSDDLDLEKSISSQVDMNLMEAVFSPPHGFGNETMLHEEMSLNTSFNINETIQVDVESDNESEAGFSTISGGTIMRRTESGRYSTLGSSTLSRSSLASSVSSSSKMRGPSSVVSSESKDSLLPIESRSSDKSMSSVLGCQVSSDNGRNSLQLENPSTYQIENGSHPVGKNNQEDTYVTLKPHLPIGEKVTPSEDEYVVLRHTKLNKDNVQEREETSQGMQMLFTSYGSEEDSSGNSRPSRKGSSTHDDTMNSICEELQTMPAELDIKRKKSISAQDLQTAPKVMLPVRSQSLFLSPCKKFNYKPHLEITRETHTMLARAGYMKPSVLPSKSRDVPVPVKSPKRSAHREEMMTSLRASFHERRGSLSSSLRSSRKNFSFSSNSEVNSSLSTINTSISSKCEKMSLNGTDMEDDAVILTAQNKEPISQSLDSEISKKVHEYSSKIVKSLENDDVHHEIVLAASPQKSAHRMAEKSAEPFDSDIPDDADDTHTKLDFETEDSSSKKMIRGLSDSNKDASLSGFLDTELAQRGPMRIKRAEIRLSKHTSVLDIQEQHSGLVAENVRNFTQSQRDTSSHEQKCTHPMPHKRGVSPLRIPTIFAKSEEKARQYREISSFTRERIGGTYQVKSAKEMTADETEDLDTSDDVSFSGRNTTVIETQASSEAVSDEKSDTMMHTSTDEPSRVCEGESEGPSCLLSLTPGKGASIELSDSLLDTINMVCTPETEKLLASKQDNELLKSPLQESTNTKTLDSTDNSRGRTKAGHTPRRPNFPTERTRPSSVVRHQRPHLKRLQNSASARRRPVQSSPGQRVSSPANSVAEKSLRKTKTETAQLSSVPKHLSDDDINMCE